MAVAEPENLFPLPLTPFEQFMLADESDGYPMTFYMQARFLGHIDRQLQKLATADALSRHPLLCCRVRNTWRGAEWVWAGDQIPETDWDTESWSTLEPWRQAIDLTTHPGLRRWGQQEENHTTITLQFHHSCCDGIGASRFLEDFSIAYAYHHARQNSGTTAPPDFRPLDVKLLKQRNSPDGRRIANLRRSFLGRVRVILKYSILHLRQQKVPLLPKSAVSETSRAAGFGLQTLRLSRQETRALRATARRAGSSLNDLLVRDLMVTAQEWNESIKTDVSRPAWKHKTISVLVPNSLRGPSDYELPACNVVSYVFLTRAISQIAADTDDQLLGTIRDEMKLIQRHQAGWFFVQVLAAVRKLPGATSLMMYGLRRRCMSTVVLSHMGNLVNSLGSRLPKRDGKIQIGNLLLDEVSGIAPLRPNTNAAFATMIMQDCLQIGLRCNPAILDHDNARELLQRFASRLRTTAALARD